MLAELGGLDDAMEIATAQDRARVEAGIREVPRDVAEARLRRSLGRLLRRAWRLEDSERALLSGYELAVEVDE